MPSSEDSAGHNPSRVSIDNARLKTHKFSTVKNEITAKNVNARKLSQQNHILVLFGSQIEIISVRVKVSNFISNIMIISLYVSTLQWCLHQEVHVTLDTDTTISNSQMKMQIFEMRMLWKTRSYYLPFLRAIFLI